MVVLGMEKSSNRGRHILATKKPFMKPEKLSKFLSLVLRHKPQEIGLELDVNGWADIASLIALSRNAKMEFDEKALLEVVATSDKKRFAISDDGKRIRANQGHSIPVELNLTEQSPPDVLYHGTASRFLDSILSVGLSKMNRHHVHLTENTHSAISVGSRYGKAVLLAIDAKSMYQQGCTFYKSSNDVWLVDAVPPMFISISECVTC